MLGNLRRAFLTRNFKTLLFQLFPLITTIKINTQSYYLYIGYGIRELKCKKRRISTFSLKLRLKYWFVGLGKQLFTRQGFLCGFCMYTPRELLATKTGYQTGFCLYTPPPNKKPVFKPVLASVGALFYLPQLRGFVLGDERRQGTLLYHWPRIITA